MSETAHSGIELAVGRIGPGTMIAICGPSGAGKDTLIAHARNLSAGQSNVVYARRVITRSSSDHEDHDSLSEAEFDLAANAGAFAFWWAAHGLKYGVPAKIDGDLAAGRCVVCNVSRTAVSSLKERYARVLTILVTAPADVIAERLGKRGRTTDGSLAQRMARTAEVEGTFCPDIVIDNAGPPEQGARILLNAVASQLRAVPV